MTVIPRSKRAQTRAVCGLLLSGVALVGSLTLLAREPREPLPKPVYSFDVDSPRVIADVVGAGDVLEYGFPDPSVLLPAPELGLQFADDDLDAMSGENAGVDVNEPFFLLFSVDRATLGMAPPDLEMIRSGVPFNVRDQAWRGQAAGDQFMSLGLYTRLGPYTGQRSRGFNNVLTHNNFNEGGTSFSADPNAHAQDATGAVPQDDVDATGEESSAAKRGKLGGVYFTLTRYSPSLPMLPGGWSPSGANILFNAPLGDPNGPRVTDLYALHSDLGLVQMDDIDALVIFDQNANGIFDGLDQVLFSLTPDSPSLDTIQGASQQGAGADVFSKHFQEPIEVFARAEEFGLGMPPDNVDALGFSFCTDEIACAELHGIRSLPGDTDCDHEVDFGDINPFVLALVEGRTSYEAAYPACNWWNADTNEDRDVDFGDINAFVDMLLNEP